ncbi:ABC transporter permease [Microbacterium sp. MYb64]|uniref:ABC transporter permease n=1 Tax=Microbacterium sp. MYb64 TaxID=1848691 RepID=UPI000CFAB04E|nr:ABC transporter permease [Microbacterium sp. MYb64]PRB09169.1 ABC transporter permease [Microbacterium sp. MYb64]
MTAALPAKISPRALRRQVRRAAAARTWKRFRANRLGMTGLVILLGFAVVAILAPILVDAGQLRTTEATGPLLAPPSLEYPLGTDDNGRSVLALLIFGSRVPLLVGLTATIISMVIGTIVGIASGISDGWPGGILFRITEWFLVIPFLPLALVLATLLGGSLASVILVIGITGWPSTALLIRAQTLSVRERPFIERAQILGAGRWHLMTKHVLPNVLPLVFANTTLTVAGAVLAETTLTFLGFGDPTNVSWGTMLNSAFATGAVSLGAWWFLMPPGICVIVVVLAFTLVGQALEDIVNPRLREGR